MILRVKHIPKYQFGGTQEDTSTSDFNNIADYLLNQQQDQPSGPTQPDYQEGEQTDEDDIVDLSETPDEKPDYEELQGKFEELNAKFEALQAQTGSTGDSMLDFMFADDNSNLPMTFDSTPRDRAESDEVKPDEGSENEPNVLNPFAGHEYIPTEAPSTLKNNIAKKEAAGYGDTNPNSTATGKYQFLWGKKPGQGWGDSIKQVTGVKNRQEFLNSPAAQEKYYSWYEKNVLAPQIQQIKPYNKQGLSDEQLGRLIHFQGFKGAQDYLAGKKADNADPHNIPISQYIKQNGGEVDQVMDTLQTTKLTPKQQAQFNRWKDKLPKKLQYEGDYDLKGLWKNNPDAKPSSNLHFPDTYKLPNHPTFSNESMYYNQNTRPYAGHWNETDSSYNYIPYDTTRQPVIEHKKHGGLAIARTPEQQHTGLNDNTHSHMLFPNKGYNTFRGLDSGQPVLLHDQLGKKLILRGRHDTAKVYGNVFEKRIN